MKHPGFVVLMLTLLVGLVFSLAIVDSAAAGSNGQQLKINVGCTWSSVTVTGKNQFGQTVTWKTTNSSLIPCFLKSPTVSTTGWWWVGNVTITRTTPTKTCVVYVPKSQSGDWVNTSCW